MVRKYWQLGILLLFIFLSLILAGGCSRQPADGAAKPLPAPLTVKVLDIGQGDAIFIRTADQAVLIDTGDVGTREKLVSYIKKEGIHVIDKVIITHAHADHLGGMAAILDNFTVKQIYDSGKPTTSNLYKQYLLTVQKKKIPFSTVTAGSQIDIGGGIALKVLNPDKSLISGTESDLNNNSIVTKLIYGNFSMLLTADAEKEAEKLMVKKYAQELKSNILKVGHHGSSSSSTNIFLKAVAPEAAVISAGAGNDYHHPHPAALKRLSASKTKIYRTDQDGTVTITSDGKSYKVSKEK